MNNSLSIELLRFKQVREDLKLTQSAFAETLGISSSASDIERGRTKLQGQTVMKLLQEFNINPLWLYGESNKKYLNPNTTDVMPKVITVDNTGNENILMVNVKAAAGYPDNIRDQSWFEELPAFSIPLDRYRNASFRSFQVEGDSMMPVLKPGEWVMGKAVSSLADVTDGAICVVILSDSVLVKKIQKDTKSKGLSLISFNPEYPVIKVEAHQLQELWQVNSKITFDLESNISNFFSQQIQQSIEELKDEIRSLKG
ncbi:MAG: DNA-binding protein [Spirochaetes bacterium]|nr:MAG: DNA-binding protein [Spirochaetota bacterium]